MRTGLHQFLQSLRTISAVAVAAGLVAAVIVGEPPWTELSIAGVLTSSMTWTTLGFAAVFGVAHHMLTRRLRAKTALAWFLLLCVGSAGATTLVVDGRLGQLGLAVCTALAIFSLSWIALLHMNRRKATTASDPDTEAG